jgi:hypothetical protein
MKRLDIYPDGKSYAIHVSLNDEDIFIKNVTKEDIEDIIIKGQEAIRMNEAAESTIWNPRAKRHEVIVDKQDDKNENI